MIKWFFNLERVQTFFLFIAAAAFLLLWIPFGGLYLILWDWSEENRKEYFDVIKSFPLWSKS